MVVVLVGLVVGVVVVVVVVVVLLVVVMSLLFVALVGGLTAVISGVDGSGSTPSYVCTYQYLDSLGLPLVMWAQLVYWF